MRYVPIRPGYALRRTGKYVKIRREDGDESLLLCDTQEAPIGRSLIITISRDGPGVSISKILSATPTELELFTDEFKQTNQLAEMEETMRRGKSQSKKRRGDPDDELCPYERPSRHCPVSMPGFNASKRQRSAEQGGDVDTQ